MKCEVQVCVLLGTLLLLTQPSSALLKFEPIQYLAAHLPPGGSPLGDFLEEANPQDAGSWLSTVKANLEHHLAETESSVVLMRREQVLLQHRVEGLEMNTSFEIPPANTLSMVAIALPILFEGLDADTLSRPVNKVLQDSTTTSSFLDLITKLPAEEPIASLAENGKVSLQFINAVHGDHAREVWLDAYMGMGVTGSPPTGNKPMTMSVNDLNQLALMMSHDSVAMQPADDTKSFPLDDANYLFGWWVNCPKATPTQCLIPHAPTDTLFSLSPDLRLYISPSLELTLIVLGPGATSGKSTKIPGSLADILIADGEIWRQFALAVENSSEEGVSQRPDGGDGSAGSDAVGARETRSEDKEPEETIDDSEDVESTEETDSVEDKELVALIHWVWPILVFLFWVTSSHVWFYWMIHIIWFCLTKVNSRTHPPRPRTAAENRN